MPDVLQSLQTPRDIKALAPGQLPELAEELRLLDPEDEAFLTKS